MPVCRRGGRCDGGGGNSEMALALAAAATGAESLAAERGMPFAESNSALYFSTSSGIEGGYVEKNGELALARSMKPLRRTKGGCPE